MSDSVSFQDTEIKQAVKDILFMYAECTHDYRGFGHGIDTGSFDAFKFLEIDADEFEYLPSPATLQLLKEGAIIKILCEIYDAWCEYEDFYYTYFERHKLWLNDGRFWEFSEVEHLMKRLFRENPSLSETWVEEEFKQIYDKYVRGYFIELANIT